MEGNIIEPKRVSGELKVLFTVWRRVDQCSLYEEAPVPDCSHETLVSFEHPAVGEAVCCLRCLPTAIVPADFLREKGYLDPEGGDFLEEVF